MARLHGRRGQLYIGLASSAAIASPVPFLGKWTIDFKVSDVDVTAFGDTNMTYVAGLPDVGGTYSGFYDNATTQLYVAASDGLPRNFYLYPDAQLFPGSYWYGTGIFDFSASGGVTEAVAINGNFKAASNVTRIG